MTEIDDEKGDQPMRNATVAALLHEFLFRIVDYRASCQQNLQLRDEAGVVREALSHEYTSQWEWSASMLEKAGVLRRLSSPNGACPLERSPFFYPLVTLDECRAMDFSAFETFDNYCHAMFTFSQFVDDDRISLDEWSPQFQAAVGSKDDIFLPDNQYWTIFNEDRFQEKVMARWEEMEVRTFRSARQ